MSLLASSNASQPLRRQDSIVRACRPCGGGRGDRHHEVRPAAGSPRGVGQDCASPSGPREGQDLDGRGLRRPAAETSPRAVRSAVRVRLLLDTHVVLWWQRDDRRLNKAARSAIATADVVWVSAVSGWEVAIKLALGRLKLSEPFDV